MSTRTPYDATALEVLTAANYNTVPKGWIGYDTATPSGEIADSGGADLISITVSVSSADRLIKISGRGSIVDATSNAVGGLISVFEGATDLGRVHRHPDGTPQSFLGGWVVVDSPSVGSHTYKLTGSTTSGDFGMFGAIDILVEDIGPAPA